PLAVMRVVAMLATHLLRLLLMLRSGRKGSSGAARSFASNLNRGTRYEANQNRSERDSKAAWPSRLAGSAPATIRLARLGTVLFCAVHALHYRAGQQLFSASCRGRGQCRARPWLV